MIKKLFIFSFLFVFLMTKAVGLVQAQEQAQGQAQEQVPAQEITPIYFFYGQGCPHCSIVEDYFEAQDLYTKYPIEKKEIYFNRDNALLFNSLMSELGVPDSSRGVPTVIIGDQALTGDRSITNNFIDLADKYLGNDVVQAEVAENDDLPDGEAEIGSKLTLAAVIGASIVDAVNPCAFAVLIILMGTILVAGDSKKALKSGLAFAASIFISYFLMGLGLYQALAVGGLAQTFFKIVGWMAIILGLLNLKDWLWYGKGVLMEVPLSWRPKLKQLLNSVTNPVGAFGIGFVISLFLLPCTSGPYIVILGMLANAVSQVKAIVYLIIYNLIFVLPMVVISFAVYKGFDPNKAEEIRQKRLKTLHLIAGIIMLIMGIVIVGGWI